MTKSNKESIDAWRKIIEGTPTCDKVIPSDAKLVVKGSLMGKDEFAKFGEKRNR